jgi:tetratricopeptide (TPR) repeat protein
LSQRSLDEAEALWTSGRRAEALRHYAAAAKSDPGWMESHRIYQDRMLEAGERDAVEAEYRRALERSRTPRALILAGRLARSPEEGEALFREAKRRDEGDPWVRYALGHCLALRGYSGREMGRDHFREAERELEAATQIWSDFPDALLMLAEVRDELGELEPATRSYRRYLEHKSGDVRAWFNLGFLLQRQGRSREAQSAYREVLRRDPSFHRAHLNIGQMAERDGRAEVALREFRKALELAPRDPDIHYNLGVLMESAFGDKVAAYRHFRNYLDLGGRYRFRVQEWVERLEREGIGNVSEENLQSGGVERTGRIIK